MYEQLTGTRDVAQDTANLQAACDRLSLSTTGADWWEWGTLRLNGYFNINKTIRCGSSQCENRRTSHQ